MARIRVQPTTYWMTPNLGVSTPAAAAPRSICGVQHVHPLRTARHGGAALISTIQTGDFCRT
jgi:hypothetical protein